MGETKLDFVKTSDIVAGHNIRSDFDGIESLTSTVKQQGILQPIAVRPMGSRFELISGGRRFEAAKRAGVKEIPAVIRDADERQRLEEQIIENVQRENLSALDEGHAYKRYQALTGMSQNQMARKFGRTEQHVSMLMCVASRLTRDEQAKVRAMDTPPSARALYEATLTKGDDRKALIAGEVNGKEMSQVRKRRRSSEGKKPKPGFRIDLPLATVHIKFKRNIVTKADASKVMHQAMQAIADTKKWGLLS